MKHIFYSILIIIAITSTSCNSKSTPSADGFIVGDKGGLSIDPKDPKKSTTIQWIDDTVKLGDVSKKAGLVDISFRFKNTGKNPLCINAVTAGCGCTSPQKPNKLIQPGEESMVKAKFRTEGRTGDITKYVYVNSNADSVQKTLVFTAKMKD